MSTVPDLSGINPTDQKFCAPNRTAATTAAVMALTPLFTGEVVLALDTGTRYRGLEVTAGRWGVLTVATI
jgi:hypothetical protein